MLQKKNRKTKKIIKIKHILHLISERCYYARSGVIPHNKRRTNAQKNKKKWNIDNDKKIYKNRIRIENLFGIIKHHSKIYGNTKKI